MGPSYYPEPTYRRIQSSHVAICRSCIFGDDDIDALPGLSLRNTCQTESYSGRLDTYPNHNSRLKNGFADP